MSLRRYGKYTLWLLFFCACAKDSSEYVIKINGHSLDKEAFVIQFKVSPAYRRGDALSAEVLKKHIDETVLNRMLFEVEGYRLGMENDSTVMARVEEEKRRQLIRPNGALYRAVIPDDFEPTTEEIQALYQGQAVKVKFAHIWVNSRALADSIHQLLISGADFGAVAKAYSAEIATGRNGGVRDHYYTRGLFPANVDDVLFDLQPGEMSPPLPAVFGYHIVKLLDKTSNELRPFPEMEGTLRQTLILRKRNGILEEFVSGLMEKNKLRLERSSIHYIFPMYAKDSLTEAARLDTSGMSRLYMNKVLLLWDGGEMTVGQFAARYNSAAPTYQIPLHTPEDIIAFARNEMVEELLYREAIARKLDKDREFVASISKYRDSLVGQSCRRALINERVKVTEEEIREAYASNDSYSGAEYDKVRARIETTLLREKSVTFADTIVAELRTKYRADYNHTLLESLSEELTRMRDSERGESDNR